MNTIWPPETVPRKLRTEYVPVRSIRICKPHKSGDDSHRLRTESKGIVL